MRRAERDETGGGAAGGGAPSVSGEGTRCKGPTLHTQRTWRELVSDTNMPDAEERRIMEELDREVSSKGGLVALVVCLVVAVALLAAGAMGVFGAATIP